MITRKLSNHVTNFSMSLNDAKHATTVVVGGAITDIFDTQNWCLDDSKASDCPILVTLDDGLGTFRSVFLRDDDPLKDKAEQYKDMLKLDNVVLITGFVEKFDHGSRCGNPEVRIYADKVTELDFDGGE